MGFVVGVDEMNGPGVGRGVLDGRVVKVGRGVRVGVGERVDVGVLVNVAVGFGVGASPSTTNVPEILNSIPTKICTS